MQTQPTLVLEVLTPGAQLGDRYIVHPKQKILLGRTRVSDIVFDDLTVTQRHAWLWFEDGKWMIRDAGSAGGTFINDGSIPYGAEVPLPYGSKLRLGGFDLRVSEGAPDLEPSIPPGPYPRYGGEAATTAARNDEARAPRTPPFAGRFVLHELLGRGNQGVVHRAYDDERKGFVALKIFDPMEDPVLIERFLSRKTSQALRFGSWIHKHIAWGVVERTPYLAMELAQGELLSERLKGTPLTMKQAVELVRSLGYGVGSLHEEGLSHRNIKPDNIRFSQYVPDSAELSDTWIDTDRSGRQHYRPDLLPASRGFIAPELRRNGQWDARTADAGGRSPDGARAAAAGGRGSDAARADVYSLAAVLYRLVAGCMPVPDPDDTMAYGQISLTRSDLPQPLAEVRPDAPRVLCDVLHAALSPSPEDRPATGKELSFALYDVAKTMGLAGAEPPFPVTGLGAGRRAAPRPRPPIDPFTDKVFQEELTEIVVPRCKIDKARSHLYSVIYAHHHADRAKLSGCALCGVSHFGLLSLEVQPDGFFLVPKDEESRARRPYLCHYCLWGEHRAAHTALTEALADLETRGDDPMRPGGPTRRELREGLLRLMKDALPRMDDHAVCTRCKRSGDTLIGAEMNICLSCVAAARAAADAQIRGERDAREERVRAEYARLHVRAQARLVRQGKRTRQTSERDVPLPPRGGIGDWFYLDIEELERAAAPSQARIDEVGAKLASSIEAHVIASLEKRLDKGAPSPFESRAAVEQRGDETALAAFDTQGTSGLPSYLARYLARCRPSEPLAERLEMAIAVMSELLHAGYSYSHKIDECEWADATPYFEAFHQLADRPPA